MKSLEIRKRFFDFFVKNGHEKVASSSLIPAQDPTILFANAGMNQFKDCFLGNEKRSYNRAATIQKCVRAGGKHNDLDNVGFTKRHLTFFEMMGNFSFGDYFKKEAIHFAWDFITQELKMDQTHLHVSIYHEDEEAFDIWHKEIGIPKEKIHRLGAEDNFWQMGDTGPCGPCTEIHLDRGASFGCADNTGCTPACSCDRFLEFWNLVFMQYDMQPGGVKVPLKRTGVDTGMGLERLCAIMQNVDSVYHTDLFTGIIKRVQELTGIDYEKQDATTKAAFHVLADHIRSSTMIIADGGTPSNEGRGYVLRKIIRRAALFAQKLTAKNIFPELSRTIVQEMSSIYPELVAQQELVYKTLEAEIEKFAANLTRGKAILEKYVEEHQKTKVITGAQAFKLYDTFGFPMELIILLGNEHGFTVDQEGFATEMEKQRAQSGKKETHEGIDLVKLPETITNKFTGYQEMTTASHIIALIEGDQLVKSVKAGNECWIICEKTPFFIEGGGQVADQGWVTIKNQRVAILEGKKISGGVITVRIATPIDIKVGDEVLQEVNPELRVNAMKNHTATHLLQAALMQLFGKQIKQSGSLVTPDYLRFDFTYPQNLSNEDIRKVEDLVNNKIRENIPTHIEETSYKHALEQGVIAFFGDKYNPECVRVVSVPGFSAELCGGTHVRSTGDIGTFKITEVSALSAGHRRIVAVTGPKAIELFQDSYDVIKHLSQEFKAKREDVLSAVERQTKQIAELNTQIKQLKKQLCKTQLPVWEQQIDASGKVPFLFITLENSDAEEMRDIAQQLTNKKPGLYFLLNKSGNTVSFLASLDAKLKDVINFKEFANWLRDVHNLRGGGSATMVQGGGTHFNAELGKEIKQWLK